MIGRIDRDNEEEKKCYDMAYGKKFKSFKKGYLAGKIDAKKNKDLKNREPNPYLIDPDVLMILKQRARWFEGYDQGWQKISDRKKKKGKVNGKLRRGS